MYHVHVHVWHNLLTVSAFLFRQKVTISKLQQDVHESEAKLHHLMVAQVHEHGGSALEARLQVHIHVHVHDIHTPVWTTLTTQYITTTKHG